MYAHKNIVEVGCINDCPVSQFCSRPQKPNARLETGFLSMLEGFKKEADIETLFVETEGLLQLSADERAQRATIIWPNIPTMIDWQRTQLQALTSTERAMDFKALQTAATAQRRSDCEGPTLEMVAQSRDRSEYGVVCGNSWLKQLFDVYNQRYQQLESPLPSEARVWLGYLSVAYYFKVSEEAMRLARAWRPPDAQ